MVTSVGLNSGYGSNVNFCSNNSAKINAGELENCLLARDKNLVTTENGNTYKKSGTNSIIGLTIGTLAPLLTNIVKNKGIGGILKSWKTLAISCPALGLAGLAVGSIIDNIVNTKKAQKADEQANKLPEDLANTRLGVNTVV